MLILLMWETPLRGDNIGRVNLDELFTAEGQPILSPNGYLQLPTCQGSRRLAAQFVAHWDQDCQMSVFRPLHAD